MTTNQTITSREAVLAYYTVNANGIVTSPGKFEGQAVYVPHFWSIGLEGFADSDNGKVFGFKVTPADRGQFPELSKRKRVLRLTENNQGFVYEV